MSFTDTPTMKQQLYKLQSIHNDYNNNKIVTNSNNFKLINLYSKLTHENKERLSLINFDWVEQLEPVVTYPVQKYIPNKIFTPGSVDSIFDDLLDNLNLGCLSLDDDMYCAKINYAFDEINHTRYDFAKSLVVFGKELYNNDIEICKTVYDIVDERSKYYLSQDRKSVV